MSTTRGSAYRLDAKIGDGGNILLDTTMCRSRRCRADRGRPALLLVIPNRSPRRRAAHLFASIEEGTRIHSMRGDKQRLFDRAGRVAGQAISRLPGDRTAGRRADRLFAGCMLCSRRRHAAVVRAGHRPAFPKLRSSDAFTFGDQGCIVDRNVHGNLMISAVAFGR